MASELEEDVMLLQHYIRSRAVESVSMWCSWHDDWHFLCVAGAKDSSKCKLVVTVTFKDGR